MSGVKRATVIGAGTMGHGIAQVAAAAGIDVALHDVAEELIEKGLGAIRANLDKGIARGKVTEEQRDAVLARVRAGADLEAVAAESDLVIEAVPESVELKQSIFRRLDEAARADAVLASNTSSLSIAVIAAATSRPERVVGMHFFNPVHLMPLVEVVRGASTSSVSSNTASARTARVATSGSIPWVSLWRTTAPQACGAISMRTVARSTPAAASSASMSSSRSPISNRSCSRNDDGLCVASPRI